MFNKIKQYIIGVLKGWFINKPTLDNFESLDVNNVAYNNNKLLTENSEEFINLNNKIDNLNIAQKTVNNPLEEELLNAPVTFTLNKTKVNGQGLNTNIKQNINLSKAITEFDNLSIKYKIKMMSSGEIFEDTEIFSIKNIIFNESFIVLSFCISSQLANAFGAYVVSLQCRFDNVSNLYVLHGCNPYSASTVEFTITSINGIKSKCITVDPVEYIDTSHGIEDTPIGTIISCMSISPPKHYLSCDGSIYNISDYPYLAEHFKTQFGSYNYFGGDGTATFAVPNLKGEFLRGAGTNNHATSGHGANVGKHQDATFMPFMAIFKSGKILTPSSPDGNVSHHNLDSVKIVGSGYKFYLTTPDTTYTPTTKFNAVSTRPTNTSVLYCIKYEPTFFMSITNNISTNYSTQEQLIGTWIDGKNIYKKVIPVTIPGETLHGIDNMDTLVNYSLTWYDSLDNAWHDRMRLWDNDYGIGLEMNIKQTEIHIGTSRYNSIEWSTRITKAYAILEYTKIE